ncbi:hypothetical protein [Pantoea sp. S18]|uniref:hypothetical protein n=1 Tax=Pantoea sp. S18 TaxID=3019892 RepID=UPI002B1F563E|nr:hypothetical protein [Pantoea sp. S18]MEA5104679.1 hypothetical protein [Pantoea sp. S18]
MNAETIKDFLVSLGFQIDEAGARKFDSVVAGTTAQVVKMGVAVEAAALSVVAYTAKIASGLDNLYWASQRTGATVAGIQQIGFAVSQMGGTVEGARSSLESLARFMRNSPGAEGFLNRLGVQTRDAKGNMRDMASVFTGVGQRLSNMPYYRANQYAQMLGIDENTLMAMRRGVGQFSAQYSQMAKAIGYNADQAAVSSNKFVTSLRSFGQMAGMARDKIGSNLAEGLSGSIDTLRKQIVDNFPKIEGVITSGVKGLLWLAEVIGRVVCRLIQAGADIMSWWSSLDKSTQRLIEIFGALILAWKLLNSAFLTSPIGIITALGLAILALYDDYKTWKEGGKSLIDWKKWEPEITNAIKAIDDLKNRVMSLLGIDPKTWSAKWDLSNLTENLGGLAKMLDGIARLLNAIKDGRWKDAYSIGREIMQQKGNSDAMPQVSSSANGVADWIKGKTGFDPRSIGRYFTGDDADGDLKRGERNNNPGNLNFVGQAGASLEKPGGRFAKFETAYDGLRAMARQLTLYAQRGINTVEGIISTWAPSSENNTGAYVNAIASKLGVNPNAALNLQNPQVLSQLMDGIIRHENGRNIYPSELVNRAAGGGASLHQETVINIHGVSDPKEAGNIVADKQNQVSSRATQQLMRRGG